MTATAADQEIFEIMRYVEGQLRTNDSMRQELATAVRRKDQSAMRKVATALWRGLRVVAPFALAVILEILGIPAF